MSLAIRLEPDIEQRLENLVEKTGCSKTFYMQETIIEHLEQLKDNLLSITSLRKTS